MYINHYLLELGQDERRQDTVLHSSHFHTNQSGHSNITKSCALFF